MVTWANTTWIALSDGDDKGQQQAGEVRRETIIRVAHPDEEVTAQEIVDKLQAGDDGSEAPWRARVGLPLNYWSAPGLRWKHADPPMADYQPTETDSEMALNGAMITNSINCAAYPGSTRCHDIRVVTTGFGPVSNDTTAAPTGLQVDPPLVTVTGSGKGVTSPAWRADPCAAHTPAASCPATPEAQPASAGDPFAEWTATDIFGTAVDYNVQPQPVSRKQIAIEISVLRRGPWYDWSDYTSSSTGTSVIVAPYSGFNVATLDLSQHHRNREDFIGFPYGSLLLTDTKMVRVHHSYFRITYSLLFDEWRHARQRPKAVITNSNEGAKTIVDGISHLTDVFWLQQFLGSVDLDLGFNSAEMLILNEWGS